MKKISVYQVDDNVPMPSTSASLPPLRQLEVGQSILFPLEKRAMVQSSASRFKRETGRVFKIQKQDDQTARVWRVR